MSLQTKKPLKALLVFNKTSRKEFRIITTIQSPILAQEIQSLLKAQKHKQAFGLIASQAQVDRYLPPGAKLFKQPDIILTEDTL